MKKSFWFPVALIVLSSMLSGCIIWPWWDEGGRGDHGHHGGGYEHGDHEHGERR